MIKRGDLKYQRYGWDEPEVWFDVGSDPGETRDVLHRAEYGAVVAAFRQRATELGYGEGK